MANGDFNAWLALAEAWDEGTQEAVINTAEALQSNVKAQVRAKDVYDTGRLYRSVYKKTIEGSDYEQEDEKVMPEIPDQPDAHTAYVAVGAIYAAIQNYGGHGITGRPYWEQGIMDTRQTLDNEFAKIAVKNIPRKVYG